MPVDAFTHPDNTQVLGELTVKRSPMTRDTGVSFDDGLILSDGAGNLIANSFIFTGAGGLDTSLAAYGTTADGEAAVAAALTAVNAAGGGSIYTPPGTWLFPRTLTTLGSNIEFYGDGDASIWKLANQTNTFMINSTTSYSNITFRDMAFDGNGTNQTDGATRDDRKIIIIQNVPNLKFLNCTVHDGRSGAQVHIASCDYARVQGCKSYNVGISATFLTDAWIMFNSAQCSFLDNKTDGSGSNNPDTAYVMLGCTDSVINNNTSVGMCAAAYGFSPSKRAFRGVISGNSFRGAGSTHGTNGISVGNFGNAGGSGNTLNNQDVEIIGNVLSNFSHAMQIDSADRVQVVGNEFTDAAGSDLMALEIGNSNSFSVSDIAVRGNKFHNCSRDIYFHGPNTYSGNIILENNDFDAANDTPLTNVSNPAAANLYWRNNAGWNPVGNFSGSGGKPATPGIPNTTAAYTNVNPYDAMVYITANAGGTTAVAIGGIAAATIAASDTMAFRVPCQQTITLTYTSAPTWTWFGD